MAPVANPPTGIVTTRKGFLSQRRKAKLTLRPIAIFLAALIIILAAVDLVKYPYSEDSHNYSMLPALLLMPTAGVTIIWSTIEIILLLVRGGTTGIHPLAVAIVDILVFIGGIVEFCMLLTFRSVDFEGWAPLNHYFDGDEYLWSSFTFHLLLLLTLIPIFAIAVSEHTAMRTAKAVKAIHNRRSMA